MDRQIQNFLFLNCRAYLDLTAWGVHSIKHKIQNHLRDCRRKLVQRCQQ